MQKKHVMQKIAAEIHDHPDMTWIVCGDFNFEAFGERSFNAERGAFEVSIIRELGISVE